jgi:hypothetical protein
MALSRRAFLLGAGAVAVGSEGFGNAILGGASKLIRAAIQSPNYLAGVAGWTINKDGSVEFNNGTFRGTIVFGGVGQIFVYKGAPALNNLVAAISPSFGTDAYGNTYYPGLTLPNYTGGLFGGSVVFTDPSGTPLNPGAMQTHHGSATSSFLEILGFQNSHGLFGTRPLIRIAYLNDSADSDHEIILSNVSGRIYSEAQVHTFDGGTYSFGTGPVGGYYYEGMSLSLQTIPSAGASVQIVNLVPNTTLYNDYPRAFNLATGEWTCPADGLYTHSFGHRWSIGAWVSGSRFQLQILKNGGRWASDESTMATASAKQITKQGLFVAGDVVTYTTFQSTGVNQNIAVSGDSEITVHRYL